MKIPMLNKNKEEHTINKVITEPKNLKLAVISLSILTTVSILGFSTYKRYSTTPPATEAQNKSKYLSSSSIQDKNTEALIQTVSSSSPRVDDPNKTVNKESEINKVNDKNESSKQLQNQDREVANKDESTIGEYPLTYLALDPNDPIRKKFERAEIEASKERGISIEEVRNIMRTKGGISISGDNEPSPKQVNIDKYLEQNPYPKIDFNALKKRNEDITAWLRIPSVSIDIPVVQAPSYDNNFYLYNNLDKKPSNEGCIEVDYRTWLDYNNFNSIIYGHNLSSGQGFGSLKKLLTKEVQDKENSDFIQIVTPKYRALYKIVSVAILDETDSFYESTNYYNYSNQWKTDLIEYLRNKNQVPKFGVEEVAYNNQFISLSTCYGSSGTTKRLVVFAKQLTSSSVKQ